MSSQTEDSINAASGRCYGSDGTAGALGNRRQQAVDGEGNRRTMGPQGTPGAREPIAAGKVLVGVESEGRLWTKRPDAKHSRSWAWGGGGGGGGEWILSNRTVYHALSDAGAGDQGGNAVEKTNVHLKQTFLNLYLFV